MNCTKIVTTGIVNVIGATMLIATPTTSSASSPTVWDVCPAIDTEPRCLLHAASPPTESSAPAETTDALEPTTETSVDGDIRLTFTVPDGWENNGWFVAKTDSDPIIGVVFFPVANIFSDPCQWVEVDPPVGPTVDDLAAAFANVAALNATAAIDVTVDGFHGQQIEFTVPKYDEDECRQGTFALFQDEGQAGQGPNYWAQGPDAHHRLWILDIDGTRYVIGGTYFPDTSQQDRDDIDTILNSIQIDVIDADRPGPAVCFGASASSVGLRSTCLSAV